jgi:hypothetical protein
MSMRYQAGIILPGYNPLLVPDAPTIGTATAASSVSVSVTFTAPTDIGGSAISSYLATAKKTSDGTTVSTSGAASPVVVTGLTASTTYTVTVVAVNSYGPSAPSAASNSVTTAETAPTVIGQAYGGGFYAGDIGVSSVATHYLVVAPLSSGESSLKWKNTQSATAGADSTINGPQNTADMVADGNSTVYPCAHFCNDLSTGGQTDWYMPAENELEVCYYNLKPSTAQNDTNTGINPNAVPARASNYTTGTPAQTSAAAFQTGGAQAFTVSGYWASTEVSSVNAVSKTFANGVRSPYRKDYIYRVRAVRRVAV